MDNKKLLIALYFIFSFALLSIEPTHPSWLVELWVPFALSNLANAARLSIRLQKQELHAGYNSNTDRVSQRTD